MFCAWRGAGSWVPSGTGPSPFTWGSLPRPVSQGLTLAQLSGTGSRAGALAFPRWDQRLRKPSHLCSTQRSTRWPVSSRLHWRPSHQLWGIFLRWVPGGKAHSSVGSTRGCGPRSLLPSCWSTRRLQQRTNVTLKSPAVYTHRASAQGGTPQGISSLFQDQTTQITESSTLVFTQLGVPRGLPSSPGQG